MVDDSVPYTPIAYPSWVYRIDQRARLVTSAIEFSELLGTWSYSPGHVVLTPSEEISLAGNNGAVGGVRLNYLQTRRLAAVVPFNSIEYLSQQTGLSQDLITNLEAGGSCTEQEAELIIAALAPPALIFTIVLGNPTLIVLAFNAFCIGDTVIMSGIVGGAPDFNGTHVITTKNPFGILVDINSYGGSAGAGGVVRLSGASVGLVQL